jgi:hypothetical protein
VTTRLIRRVFDGTWAALERVYATVAVRTRTQMTAALIRAQGLGEAMAGRHTARLRETRRFPASLRPCQEILIIYSSVGNRLPIVPGW